MAVGQIIIPICYHANIAVLRSTVIAYAFPTERVVSAPYNYHNRGVFPLSVGCAYYPLLFIVATL